jgi:hypothetical protein
MEGGEGNGGSDFLLLVNWTHASRKLLFQYCNFNCSLNQVKKVGLNLLCHLVYKHNGHAKKRKIAALAVVQNL